MKSAKPSDMATLLGSCPVHKAVAKAVCYGVVPCKDVVNTLKDTITTHGQAAVDGVARALLDYEQHGTVLLAKLKPALHVYCRMLLGPMPSEWADWWQHPDGTDRPGKPTVWPPTLPGAGANTLVPGPDVTANAPENVSATSVSEIDALKATHGRQLRLLLKAEHDRYLRFPPSDPIHQEAIRRMDLIEAEMRRRGNKVPPQPAWREPYDPDADQFRRATPARLRELLDMCRYELTRHPADSVTYEEAVRDIGLIEAELQRRGRPTQGSAATGRTESHTPCPSQNSGGSAMESERLMRKWAARRGWDDRTKEMLVYAFLDELGPEALSLLDRYLAKTAAGADDAVGEEADKDD